MSVKKGKAPAGEVFTIDLDQQSDSYEIPGVTQLLNPEKMAERAQQAAQKTEPKKEFTLEPTRTVATGMQSPPPIIGKPGSLLKDLGVLFDFQFALQDGTFLFQNGVAHAEAFVQGWQQEVLDGMKLDLKALLYQEPFQEFRYETYGYLYSAFAAQPQHFIQIVQTSPEAVHVLLSKQSLAARKDTVLDSVRASSTATSSTKSDDSEKSLKIELDLTG